ncbi:MAG: hypothetical protein IKB97_02505 [Bacteroidaceae bacterium]|nr:hypothetical protein [Bacteroidaceae bacterium]
MEDMNYSRFYASFNKLPYDGDRDDLKQSLVVSHTNGRTDSLREMTAAEYRQLCENIERKVIGSADSIREREELRRKRSIALRLLQSYGVESSIWSEVDKFCLQPRIAGKRFIELTIEELDALTRKMRAIINKLKDGQIK